MSELKKIRGDMSLRELSSKTGISFSYLSELENGVKKNPTISIVSKLESVLGEEVREIFLNNSSL